MMLHCSVAEAQERIDSQEFAEWMAYDRVDPFGEHRADLRAALVASVIANSNRGKNKSAFKLEDFMLDFSGEKKRQDWMEMQSALFTWADVHNKSLKAKK